ncbi:6-bladed beta-propeller [Parabacteroides sp. AF48-14]|uniref:6-bladed beta-propeller n=1 Tax=Parabacteroides sp. AF48-14 TaxID=2292052 RepID=UPI000EFE80FF|nr:6-bladed beta-propeller [Parabacteroides sp. AF48-14]RHO75375.1 6-bladed beta-propeller [Parabacteroides sp. AF48-14]
MNHILVFSILVFCLSCQKKQEEKGLEKEIRFSTNVSDIPIDTLFEDIKYTPLELTDSSLVGDIKRIVLYNTDLYIYDRSDGIIVFDMNGKYKYRLQHKGNGIGEYAYMFNFNMNNQGDISIISRPSFIYTYTNDDQFVSRIMLEGVSIKDIYYLNDSTLLVRSADDQDGYKINIVDMNKKQITHSYHPIQGRMLDFCMNDCFTTYNGKLLLNTYQSLDIYELTKDSLSIRYTVNVSGKVPPRDFWDRKIPDWQLIAEWESSNFIAHIPCFTETDRSVLLRYEGKSEESKGYAFVNKKTALPYVFKKIIWDDKFRWEPEFMYPLNDGYVAICLSASVLLEQGSETMKERFPNLHEESNPILMLAKVK